MISRSEYYSIRGEQDFLYRYFIKCGGMQTSQQLFKTTLARWIKSFGLHPQQGVDQIIKFLDQKFA